MWKQITGLGAREFISVILWPGQEAVDEAQGLESGC